MSGFLYPVTIAGIPAANIADYITGMSISLSMDFASQISINLIDPNFEMLKSNYFQIRQSVQYMGMNFEISVIEVGQGPSGPTVNLDCRPAAMQALKRQKTSEVVQYGNATGYVGTKAREVGLAFFGENTPARKNVSQASNDQSDESVWDIIQRLCSETGFVCFEVDGRLFFCSEPFLLGKFSLAGYGTNPGFLSIPVRWSSAPMNEVALRRTGPVIPGPVGRPPLRLGSAGAEVSYLQDVLTQRAGQVIRDAPGAFGLDTERSVFNVQAFTRIIDPSTRYVAGSTVVEVGQLTWRVIDQLASGVETATPSFGTYYLTPLGVPGMRVSDDAYTPVEASFSVEREYGRALRPGMTVSMEGIPGFEGYYIVNDVAWAEGTPDPVNVSVRTLVEPKPDKQSNNEELNIFRQSLSYTGGGLANTTYLGTLGRS